MRKLTDEQRAKSDERKARFRAMVKQVADMTDAQRDTLAAKMIGVINCEGRTLSPRNCCLVAMQCPTATIVGGFQQWIKQGRAVRKGETSISIWIPTARARKNEDGEKIGEDTGFICGAIFDISQTEAIETPAPEAPVNPPHWPNIPIINRSAALAV